MNIEITIDPLDVSNYNFGERLGILPKYVTNEHYFQKDLKTALKEQYKFPFYENESGSVNEDGVFSYPGDPDLYPLIKIKRGSEVYYQYEYALVAIVQEDGSYFITRMD